MTGGLGSVLLAVHVSAGSLALLLALGLLAQRREWSGAAGAGYLVAVLTTCATALVLVFAGSSLPPSARVVLVVVAGLTAMAAAAGIRSARRGTAGHPRLLHGSVVSLATAVAVVSAPVAVWLAVAALGTVLVEAAAHRRPPAGAGAAAAGAHHTSRAVAGSPGTTPVTELHRDLTPWSGLSSPRCYRD